MNRQRYMGCAGAFNLVHHSATGRDHDRIPSHPAKRLSDIHRTALDTAGDKAWQDLHHGRSLLPTIGSEDFVILGDIARIVSGRRELRRLDNWLFAHPRWARDCSR